MPTADVPSSSSSSTAHPTWWRAPLVASSFGLPLLALEYGWFASEDGPGAFGGILYWATGLFVLAWVLPHRRSLRGVRMAAAVTGLGCALLPPAFAILLGAAMASG
ncbi:MULTISPECIES: hypothetical protein [unclassified Streptomyces]|uniref:hypothetical protein n=1 Tax=unclassified Streptomyces TaxID=2593676 RepID=UPI00093B3271|nr:hypothetical protein [Streptomyces sp. TSRI0107]OKJ71414.1 hypothetical protein AMK31_34990 [Streptomyces sp. TSRI0107]